jgi:hypothetical protein
VTASDKRSSFLQNLTNGTSRFKKVRSLNTITYSFLEISGGQSSNLYLNIVHFSTPVLVTHLWQLKTVVFLHWCLIHAVPGNTEGGSITVLFTSCLTGLESAVRQLTIFVFICKNRLIQTSQTGGTVMLPPLVFPSRSIVG